MNQNTNPHPNIRASVVYIDPVRARELFEGNAENQRNIKKKNLEKIEASIRKGIFRLNGESIIVSEKGRLLNGQHRVTAVMNTQIGIWSVLVENVPDAYFDSMDCGSSRQFKDVLTIGGNSNAHVLATTIQRLAEHSEDESKLGTGIAFSHTDLMGIRELADGVEDSITVAARATRVVAPSRTAWLHFLASKSCPLLGDSFFEQLASGANLPERSPIFLFRERMLREKADRNKLDARSALALLIKAWNAHVDGKSIGVLRWKDDEPFPIARFPREAGSRGARVA